MTFLLSQLIGLIGALEYRLRGSGWDRNKFLAYFNKWWFAISYGVAIGVHDRNIIIGALAGGVMKFVCVVGRDVSGFNGNPPKEHNNCYDWIDPKRFANSPVAYTAYRLFIQGTIGGILLVPFAHSLFPILGGALMAPIYFTGCYLLGYKFKIVNDGLRVSELLFGYVFAILSTTALWLSYAG